MNNLISENYLMHHGVKGMKWGVRHDPERVGQRAKRKAAKNRLKDARKAYSKSYNSAYRYSYRHPITQYIKGSKAHIESDRRWKQATKDASSVISAKKNYTKVAGKGRSAADTAGQIAKAVGGIAATAAISVAASQYMINPAFRSVVNSAMKTAMKSTSANAKRGFDYMTKARYNKANQIGTLANAVKNASKFEKASTNASRAAAKASSYKSMNANAKKVGKAYGKATGSIPSVKDIAKDTAKAFKTDARMASRRVSSTRDTGYKGYKAQPDKTSDPLERVLREYDHRYMHNKSNGRPKWTKDSWSKDIRNSEPKLVRARKK